MKRTTKKIDKPFLAVLLIIVGIGLLMIFSASMYSSSMTGETGYSQFLKQAMFAIIGFAAMLIISRIDYRIYKNEKFVFAALGITILLLALVLVPGVGIKVNDARRWLPLGFTNFQPSELAKITGILYMAAMVTIHPGYLKNTWQLCKWIYLPMLLVLGLTAIEPSLSAAMAIGVGMMAVLWLTGIDIKKFAPLAILLLAAVGGMLLLEPWRFQRIMAMFGKSTLNYQISQSLVAFGSGGIFGQGLGNGKQKLLFLPEIQNDFIFANIGEEFGLIGCLLVLALYIYMLYRGYRIAFACKDRFGYLYTASVMTLLGFQVFVNIGVAINAIPVTGMALPFISYGGTSITVLFIMMGPIINISRSVNLPSSHLMNSLFTNKNTKKSRITYENTRSSGRNRGAHLSGNSHRR